MTEEIPTRKKEEETQKTNRKPSGRFFHFAAWERSLKPRNWGLRKRFLLTTGFLLVAGVVFLVLFVSSVMESTVRHSIDDRLKLFDQWMKDELTTEKNLLITTAAFVSSMPETGQAMEAQDRERLKNFILPYIERIRISTGSTSLYLHFHLPPATSFLRTWNIDKWGDDLSSYRQMVVRANREQASLTGFEVGLGGPVIRSISPVILNGKHLGSVEAALDLAEAIQNLSLPQDYGITILLNEKFKAAWDSHLSSPAFGQWIVIKSVGSSDSQLAGRAVEATGFEGRFDSIFFRRTPLEDFQGNVIGEYILSYNGSSQLQANSAKLSQFVWLFMVGATAMWTLLYLNVRRIMDFLDRLRRIIIASQSNDFADRFESDHVHCLDVLKCGNVHCPVHRNPALVCYLETGSEAISPTWRNTCIFISEYVTCHACPVYKMRHADELMDMRNVINTMMRLWSLFLGRVGTLLSEVLRSQNQPWHLPSLDQVSDYLEQMAKLTAFSHDLQGVYNGEEVYRQLSHVFQHHFSFLDFTLLEVSHSENRMQVVIKQSSDHLVHSQEVLLNSDLCRAKRAAEEVCSHPNPVLCPYFNCDHKEYIRCCMPMVMGGKVGAVFSFVVPRTEWDVMRKKLVMLRRYLDETAPMLSSMRLLEITKEQSFHDPLTLCYNRRFMDAYITQYESLSKRDGKSVGFLMADMDYFKQVNDQYGHQAGDSILQQTVKVIQSKIRQSDMVVRYGGEEFLVLLMEALPGASEAIAEKIRSAIEQHNFVLPNGATIHKTISLGVAEYPRNGDTMYKVMKYSDVALYTAKEQGRNRVVLFEEGMWTGEEY